MDTMTANTLFFLISLAKNLLQTVHIIVEQEEKIPSIRIIENLAHQRRNSSLKDIHGLTICRSCVLMVTALKRVLKSTAIMRF